MEAPEVASQPASARTPEGLRQRQRDYLSPRGRYPTKTAPGRIFKTVRELESSKKTAVTILPVPRSKTAEGRSPVAPKKRPVQEGLQPENDVNRWTKREVEDGKPDIAPDGGSAGREGRHFTVANVGNNGKIYLRPTIRPANQRYPQPSFVFPATPPSTAGLDAFISRKDAGDTPRDSLWTSTRPSTAAPGANHLSERVPQNAPRQRAHSHSTINEQQRSVQISDTGAFKIIIDRPGTRPKHSEPVVGIPTLEVIIPSYKLGTPRFSARGTAVLRGSTTTDDIRSSILSVKNSPARDHSGILSRRHSDSSPHPRLRTMAHSSLSNPSDGSSIASPLLSRRRTAIAPDMFDNLTFKPACDHPSVVRYSTIGAIRAATPARLVAEITSPTFVDYDLLSDFFLTFRSFLETSDLLYMLIARLKWALLRNDEIGTVVRVRAFVAMRHWILNYFLDDYVIDYELRRSFCDLFNAFATDLSQDQANAKVPLRILGELKKCWRRVCALYWDGPEFDTELGPEVPISPGGVAGSRNPTLDPTFWAPDGPPQLDGIIKPDFVEQDPSASVDHKYFADVSRAGHLDSTIEPRLTQRAQQRTGDPPLSPTSMISEDFVSCSFPSRAKTVATHPVAPHPVPASSIYDSSPLIATTPKALTGKRVRPTHTHNRSGSFSDSLRDRRPQDQTDQPVQKVIYKSTELLLALPYAGSLVRGNLLPPGQPYVEAIAPSTPAEIYRATTFFPPKSANPKGPSAMSGPGMRKLLGSVRRALSTRSGQTPEFNNSPTQGSFPHIPPLGVKGATINRLPGTAVVPQARPRNEETKTPMRIDLLGAEIAKDFKKAVVEDAEADTKAGAEADGKEAKEYNFDGSTERDLDLQFSTMAPETTLDPLEPRKSDVLGPPLSEVTNGSKSILIVDDTMQSTAPVMTGALPMNPSVDTFAEAFIPPSGDPTPPSTPPEAPLGTPRRSSHLLGQHSQTRSLSFDGIPTLATNSQLSGDYDRSPSHRPFGRPPRTRGHSYKSRKSISLRRYASYHSGLTRHRSERSFDATTVSEPEEVDHVSHSGSVPLPLRILRRRPGGDLKAVANVGELTVQPLRRPMSTGSVTTYSDSVRSSLLLSRDSRPYADGDPSSDYNPSRANVQTFSLGALAETSLVKTSAASHVSLFSTHSSQPIMRPSFEKEAQMLRQIPDDMDDDGGVASALLKLEGKFEQRHSDMSGSSLSRGELNREGSFGAGPLDVSTLTLGDEEEEEEEGKRRHRHEHVVEKSFTKISLAVPSYQPQPARVHEELKTAVYQPRGMNPESVALSPRSVESYNSIPLLERGLTDETDTRNHHLSRYYSELPGPINGNLPNEPTPESSHVNSFDFISDMESIRKITPGHTVPGDDSHDQSFLNSDSDDRSDLSSEMSLEVISRKECTDHDSPTVQTFPPIRPGTVIKEITVSSHPLGHPPSPPMTLTQALQMSPQKSHPPQNEAKGQLPPTPDFSPTGTHTGFTGDRLASPSMDPLRAHRIPDPSRKTSMHLPFTLAFDSQVLAQQFTLIEKDALNEIDWKDLIELRWKDASTQSRSWVDFLRTSEPRGIEVVMARFNLVVKWAVSEIVLTQDLAERVRSIIKYIHIAAQCRKYRNFTTMTQLTVALSSTDISRLTETWKHVPAADMQTLKELERLVCPTGNFTLLRREMEGAGADQGCIPFVGIYTHDLLVNSERPSQMASTPTTEPLVNFERCRNDATTIKNLLRLLEASQLYRFLPIEGITERCLWLAALSDDEIARYGKMIQP